MVRKDKMTHTQRGKLGAKIRWMNQRPTLKAAVAATRGTGDMMEVTIMIPSSVYGELQDVASHANTSPERLASEIIGAALKGGH
jgi:hypothetical protein